jgi:hypothetical protein
MQRMAKKAGSKPPGDREKGQGEQGVAGPGEEFDPRRVADDEKQPSGAPRGAPAPGVPVSPDRYEWLKRKATRGGRGPRTEGQEDPSRKKR